MSAAPSLNLLGLDFDKTDFSIPFLLINMIGVGLGLFIASCWSNVFQSALDDYKQRQQEKGIVTNVMWMNLLLAVVATFFSMAVLYLMIKAYQQVQTKFKFQV